MKIQDKLQACIDDPMWANHAEVSKATLITAVDTIKVLEREAARYHIMMRIPAESAVEERFDELTLAAELVHGEEYLSAHHKEEMSKILDQLVAEFPEAP